MNEIEMKPVAWRHRAHFAGKPLPWQHTGEEWLATREVGRGEEVEPLYSAATVAALVAERERYKRGYEECMEILQEERDNAEARIAELGMENERMRQHIANVHNRVRHEFSAAVEAAADKAFKDMNGLPVLLAAIKGGA